MSAITVLKVLVVPGSKRHLSKTQTSNNIVMNDVERCKGKESKKGMWLCNSAYP